MYVRLYRHWIKLKELNVIERSVNTPSNIKNYFVRTNTRWKINSSKNYSYFPSLFLLPGSEKYKGSNVSFLFSLRNPNDMQPFKCPIINGKNAYAINCYSLFGATFGGSHDLHIADNANANNNSYSHLGHTYQPPAGCQCNTQQTQSLFAGSYSFTPTEVEVFYWMKTTFNENTNPEIDTIGYGAPFVHLFFNTKKLAWFNDLSNNPN